MPSALAHLRAHHEATLIADETPWPIRYVLERGALLFPAPPATLEAEDLTLFVPEEEPAHDDELQLMVTLQEQDAGPGPDRWRAYHGEPRFSRWGVAAIQGARFAGHVLDPELLAIASPIAQAEPRLIRILNADRGRLAMVCKVIAGVAPAEPLAVGIDDLGIDIRARLGIIRLPFREPAPTPAQPQAPIAALFGTPA